MRFYEVWHTESGTLLGSFHTQDDALALVRSVALNVGEAAARRLSVDWVNDGDEGEGDVLLEGSALVDRALAQYPHRPISLSLLHAR